MDGEYLVARGVVDDKGQLYMLLKAAEQLAGAGELPVNLRFACDGEEETGGHSIVDYLAADDRDADACVDLRRRHARARSPGLLHRDARGCATSMCASGPGRPISTPG